MTDDRAADRYRARGWWLTEPVGSHVARVASERPTAVAYYDGVGTLTWQEYDALAWRLAQRLVGGGFQRGDRVGVVLPDSGDLHIAYTACERAELVGLAVLERTADRAVADMLRATGARGILMPPDRRGRSADEFTAALAEAGAAPGLRVIWDRAVETEEPPPHDSTGDLNGQGSGPGDLWLINSTSGTTGLPKYVQQTQDRWAYFVPLAREAAALTERDVILSAVPGTFGFGLWTAHLIPALLGVPCVLSAGFDPAETLRAIEQRRVTVLAMVTTQLMMLLAHPDLARTDLSSLRIVYTGGERVPADRAREWEARTGSTVLQFYGANETGPFSMTALSDPVDLRLTTVGRVVPGARYRLIDEDGSVIDAPDVPGQPAVDGPGVGAGYYGDEEANHRVDAGDGYVLLPDVVTIDTAGYVRIVGRKSEIIIRGGRNISTAVVEREVESHPAVGAAAAIPVPDDVFGERIGVVITVPGHSAAPSLAGLGAFLLARGVDKQYLPERLAVVATLPVSDGGKVDKALLRTQVQALFSSSLHGRSAQEDSP